MGSPYERVLGDELSLLHPRLAAYFGEIPPGRVGRGSGSFDRVGTPKRLLWPALWFLGRAGIAFPAWQKNVAFSVENRPVVDARGNVAVAAVRTFHFARGDRRMVDAITAEIDGRERGDGSPALVDHLGGARRVTARLRARVRDGALTMHSEGVGVRVGARHVVILPALSPSVVLVERFDDEVARQHVSVILSLPIIGRIYEYSGHFDYAITDADGDIAVTPGGTRP